MSAALVRRSFALGVVATIATLGSPLVGAAHADAAPAPDFANSGFTASGADVSFPAVQARPGQVVQLPTQIAVEFSAPIKVTRNDCSLDPTPGCTMPTVINAPTSYLVKQSDSSHLDGTVAVDPADDSRLLFTPPAGVTETTYTLHVGVFAKNDCPDIPFPPLGPPPACTTFDGFVNEPISAAPFAFTVDATAPTAAINSINGGTTPIDASHVKSVALAGTAASDAKSVTLTVKSSHATSPRFVTAVVTPGSPATWTASPDLSSLPDGTLTFTAFATDQAGNKTSPGTTATAPLAAHPTAPLSYAVTAGDAAAHLVWKVPSKTGGHPITGYSVTAKDTTTNAAPTSTSVSCSGAVCPTSYLLSGLTNGDDYTVSLAATTDVGKGAAATAATRPRAATSLTAKASAKVVRVGKSMTLSGRLMRTVSGSGLGNIQLTITPKLDNGKNGKPMTVRTDIFGVWHKTLKPTQSATYVVTYPGDRGDRAARASARTAVQMGIAFTSPKSGTVGPSVVLQGRVTPAKAGRMISIYRRTASGDRLIGRAKLSSASTWTFKLTLPKGTTRVFARIASTTGNLGNQTGILTLTRK